MIDQDVVRGKIGNGRFAAFTLHVDGEKMFSEYGVDYIRQAMKLLMVDAFAKGTRDFAEFQAIVDKTIVETVAQAARFIANREGKKILAAGPDAFKQTIKEVMEGGD